MSKPTRRETELERLKRDVDELIDAYERPGCRRGSAVIPVDCFKSDLTFAMQVNGVYHYRGRILNPIKQRTPSKKKHASATQVDIEAATMYRGK